MLEEDVMDIAKGKMTSCHLFQENVRIWNRWRKEQQQQQHPFNGLFFRTTWVSQLQKDRTILNFNEARDHGVAVTSAGPYANHLHFAADR